MSTPPAPPGLAVETLLARAVARHGAGALQAATDDYRAVLAARPAHGAVLHNLALALRALSAPGAAAAACRGALLLDPAADSSLATLGRCLHALDRPDAEVALRRAAVVKPGVGDHWATLAEIRRQRGATGDAERAARRAILLGPGDAGAWVNLGTVLLGRAASIAAARCHRRAHTGARNSPMVLINLANALGALGDWRPAQAARRAAMVLKPDLHAALSSYIFALDFDPAATVADVQRACRSWRAAHSGATRGPIAAAMPASDPVRRLRIGYVSGDLRAHSAAFGFAPLILRHDDSAFEVFCYSTADREDGHSARLRLRATGWRRVRALDDAALAARIRADAIDILVDLSGHTIGNRLGAFARRPAPIQASVMGTGLPEIDYVISDPVLIRPDERRHYRERVVYLEHDGAFTAFNAYAGPEEPAVAPAPTAIKGAPTLGCFNRMAKISDVAIDAWARILAARPDARLVVKARDLDDAETAAWFSMRLTRAGIAAARVRLQGGSPFRRHLAAHAEIDLMLDPFPYGGGISALDALWMGVPVLTLRGAKPSGRAASAIARTLGLDDFVATSPADYVARALDRLARPDALAALRAGLRARMKASPIGDPRLYAAAFERLYRRMWIARCAGGPSATDDFGVPP